MKSFMKSERPSRESHTGPGADNRILETERLGFRPAFYDYSTCTTYLSRYGDGRLAPVHVLDGLPEELVVLREPGGRVLAARASLVTGFERGGYFYTRINAARLVAQCARIR